MIRLETQGEMARLVLDRPEVRNALAIAHWEEIAAKVAGLAGSPVRLLVVSGAGGAFCAGADLAEFPLLQTDEAAQPRFRAAMGAAMDAVLALPIATLAHVQGPCFGAGVALAMACDLRVASKEARFAITPAKIGIGYPQGDIARLVSLVGPGWAARLLFTGSPIDAATAERIGLIESVVGGGEADQLIADLLACDPGSIAMLKRGIALAEGGIARDDEQDRRFDSLFGSPALVERLSRRSAGRALPPTAR
jgi:enoyl-CoA hydratase/carnithine racemase